MELYLHPVKTRQVRLGLRIALSLKQEARRIPARGPRGGGFPVGLGGWTLCIEEEKGLSKSPIVPEKLEGICKCQNLAREVEFRISRWGEECWRLRSESWQMKNFYRGFRTANAEPTDNINLQIIRIVRHQQLMNSPVQ